MQAVESAIEALSEKNATIKLHFDHFKIESPLPIINQTGSIEITGEIILTVTTENIKDKPKNPELEA